MKTPYVPLIEKPCSMQWDHLQGDEKCRFCQHCQLHVHNLSAMTKDEQVAVLQAPGERQCITYTAPTNAKPVAASLWVATQTSKGWRRALAAMLAAAFSMFATSCRTMGKITPPPSERKSVESQTPATQAKAEQFELGAKKQVMGGIVPPPLPWWKKLLFLE